jgi:hypothetical protein
LRRLTRRTAEIDAGTLKLPGGESVELATIPAVNEWLEGLAIRCRNGWVL